jgi:hypothetical protein
MVAYDNTLPGIVELTVSGTVTKDDITQTCTRMERDIATAGVLKVLENVTAFERIGPAAIWQDLKLALPLARKISHVAVVADQAWIRAMAGFGRLFTSASIKTFRREELEQARAWLRAA